MNDRQPDWALWRSFAAVVAEGSLSAAARSVGSSQPTLGRHIEALEGELGVTLFERTSGGLKPTDAALKLYEPVKAAQLALAEAAMLAAGADASPSGTVRITASEVSGHFILPALLVQLRDEFPDIALELVPSDSPENLLLREADIAVRMFRPTQLELIARKIAETPIVCCASASYIQRRGAPQRIEDLTSHDLVGFDRSDTIITAARGLGFTLERSHFTVRTDSQTGMWELLKAGAGVGFAQLNLVRATPGMVHLLPGLIGGSLEVWLTTHRELSTSRRIRLIYDRLGELLGDYLARTEG